MSTTFGTSPILRLIVLESDQEYERLVQFALEVDDGEATTMALAEARGLDLAVDDRKARRLWLQRNDAHQLWSTEQLLLGWAHAVSPPKAEVEAVIRSVRARARYVPRGDTDAGIWWQSFL